MAVTPVLLVGLLDVLHPPRRLQWLERLLRLTPMILVCVGYLWVRTSLLEPSSYSYFGEEGVPVIINTMLGVFALYVRLLLLPWPFISFYDWSAVPFETSFFAWNPLLCGLLFLGWLTAIVWSWRRGAPVTFWLALFLVLLIPVSQIVPVVVAAGEHFLYLAMAGPLVTVAWLVIRPCFTAMRFVFVGLGVVLLLVWGGLTTVRNQDWQTARRILEAYVADWPESFNAWMGLAHLHEREARWWRH